MHMSVKVCRAAALWIFVWMAAVSSVEAQTSLPSPWTSRDIGSPAIAGSTTFAPPSSLTLRAAGADIWGSSDQFHFVYVPVPGDVDVRARVDSIAGTSTWAKAGVMIRASLTAESAHAFTLVSYSKGLAFQRRPATGGLSVNTAGELAGAPRWVRLVRLGTQVTSYSSVDGVTWTTIGSDTIQLGATAYVGFAATSRNAYALGTATLSQAVLSVPSTLPDGQASADIGSPAIAGSASFSGDTYTITGAGADIWGTADQFHYVYQQAAGDIDVKVRIASVSYADRWSKAGVMIRGSLQPDSAHAMAIVSAGRGYAFQRRGVDGGTSAGTSGSNGVPPGWVRLKRSGSLITAYQSADGVTWTVIGSDAIALNDQVYVGIAVTSHAPAAATTIKADSFRVVQSAPAPPPNQPPTVSLTTSGTTFTAPASIALTAAASDPENQLARVEFYSGTTLLATDTAAPFAFSWSNVAAGSYAVRAVAYDSAGANASSATITVTVTAATLAAPTSVVFTKSADHALVSSYALDVFANGANPATASPVASSNLGKPAPATNGDITVNRATFFAALAPGTYVATVSALSANGNSRSATITFTR